MTTDLRVDARGLLCPLPVARLARAVAGMAPGQRVVLLADDPMAPVDVEAWCLAAGHHLAAVAQEGGCLAFTVQAKENPNPE